MLMNSATFQRLATVSTTGFPVGLPDFLRRPHRADISRSLLLSERIFTQATTNRLHPKTKKEPNHCPSRVRAGARRWLIVNLSAKKMIIRDAVLSDAPDIAWLTSQLGYSADAAAIADRLAKAADRPELIVLVAIFEEKVVGWLQAQASEVLESGFRVEIVGLVVSESCRRRGAGRHLVQHAEQWAVKIGAPAIVARSNSQRVESQIFYPALGFTPSKTQTVYRKTLKETPNQAPKPTSGLRPAAADL